MRNVQSRVIAALAAAVGALLDGVAGPDDPIWPAASWPRIKLDRGLAIGSRGGHGPIRYHVADYEPGSRVRFVFDPAIGLTGYHELRVEPIDRDHCRLVHDVVARTHGSMRLRWPLAIRWLHEALIQDLLDNAERAAAGTVARPARWSLWVRALRR
jgi:hypothetical protein